MHLISFHGVGVKCSSAKKVLAYAVIVENYVRCQEEGHGNSQFGPGKVMEKS